MNNPADAKDSRNRDCLSAEELYDFVTNSSAKLSLQSHLSGCLKCRHELAGILRLLDAEPDRKEGYDERLSSQEVEGLLAVLDQTSRKEEAARLNVTRWHRWLAAAAMILVTVGLCLGGFHLYERSKSQDLSARAAALLRAAYAPQSPSDLRLDLPFESSSSQRSSAGDGDLQDAEQLFNQALGVRTDLREARLGLAYIHLRRGEYTRAQKEFQGVFVLRGADVQALVGLGVSRFEEGISTTNPLLRAERLDAARRDFESALKLNAQSNEARFNEVRVLYELGRHQQALREIENYLSRDSSSLWSTKLRDLKNRMLMNRSGILQKEVLRAAKARDAPALSTLAHVAPHQIPPAIRSLLFQEFEIEGQPQQSDTPVPADLHWAADTLIKAYETATSDRSYSGLADFYRNLTPRQRQAKRLLEADLDRMIGKFGKNDSDSIISSSESLIAGFERLRDYWSLVRVHQLRGTIFFYGKSDFASAGAEYRRMLECAEVSADRDLIARSLAALAASHAERHQYDHAVACLLRIKDQADSSQFDGWKAFASRSLGDVYLSLNRPEESMQQYSSALQTAFRLMDAQAIVFALEGLGRALDRMCHFVDARSYYRESLARLNDFIEDGLLAPNPQTDNLRANLLSNEAYLSLDMGELQSAERSFQDALSHSGGGQLELEARNRLGLARVYLEGNRYADARAEVDKVREILAEQKLPEIDWQASTLQGFLLKQSGDASGSLERFQHAVRTLEATRSRISSIELRRAFLSRRFDPYRESVSLLYHSDQNPVRALDYADRAKCITLREYLAAHEGAAGCEVLLRDVNHSNRPPSLPAEIATLEYSLSGSEAIIFVTGAGAPAAVSVQLPLARVTATVNRYLESIASRDEPTFTQVSQQLYRDLILPVQSTLLSRHIGTITIIPDGPLYLLPFAGLLDADGHFLLEQFTISYAPSRTILQYCLAKERPAGPNPDNSVLLMDGALNLQGARNELAEIAATYGARNRIVGLGDVSSLGAIAPNYEIIHFAGHAVVHEGRPRLLFSRSTEGGFLDSGAIEKWHLGRTRLVSLLGCNTSSGPVFEGETSWGLVPAFLNAGAPSMIVSLLPVDDSCAAVLASQFYKSLARSSVSTAEALCGAQRSLLKTLGSDALRRPGDWVPFILIGDPR